MIKNLLRPIRQVFLRGRERFFPQAAKEAAELAYWRGRFIEERGELHNDHYEAIYTSAFGLSHQDYRGKCILDIGCGPRGSLEWADMVAERVGLDPLVPQYLNLGAERHKMQYCTAPSHRIPFADGHFDIVTCLNALDHVDDFEGTVAEIKRVAKLGGLFLLSTEIDHPPTPTEPISLSKETLQAFQPEFEVLSERLVGSPEDHNLHGAVIRGAPPYVPARPGVYVGKMKRQAA